MTSSCLTNCIRIQTFLDSTGLAPTVRLVKPLNYIVTLNEMKKAYQKCVLVGWLLEKEAGGPPVKKQAALTSKGHIFVP